jgi:hypothetical protein
MQMTRSMALLLMMSTAHAADAPFPASPVPQPGDLETCAFVTTNCEACMIDADGKPVCSNVGIACVPTERRCLIPKK